MEIFVDGSNSKFGSRTSLRGLCSWGIRIEADCAKEFHDHITVDYESYGRYYEQIAFVKACLACYEHGLAPEECHFIVDDEIVGYGGENNGTWSLSNGNHLTVRERLTVLCGLFGNDIDVAMMFLNRSRFTKVKGHTNVIGNLRVDYLAAHSRKVFFGHESSSDFLNYDDWLKQGFKFFNKEKEDLDIWYPAFV